MTANEPIAAREALGEEASNWFILLSEEPEDAGLRARFEQWRGTSPDHARIWERTKNAYALFGEVEPSHREHWSSHAGVGAPRLAKGDQRRAGQGRHWRPVAIVALAACSIWLALPPLILRVKADHLTGTAEVRQVKLPDGSQIHLGPKSAISVEWSKGIRQIRLLKGEAFFDVHRDPARPFRVAARDGDVTVLGTAFDVRQTVAGSSVSVERGLVQVEGRSQSAVLRAGQRAMLSAEGGFVRAKVVAGDVGAWSRGELVADRMTIDEVVEALDPWYGGKILIRDAIVARYTVSGLYDLHQPEAVLDAIATTHRLHLYRVGHWLTILSSK